MKKLGYLAGASLLFVPMPLYAAGIGSSDQFLLTLDGSQ